MNIDMNTDEKELQQLACTHFTTAVVLAIKENFENELQWMTPMPLVTQLGESHSSASSRNAFN